VLSVNRISLPSAGGLGPGLIYISLVRLSSAALNSSPIGQRCFSTSTLASSTNEDGSDTLKVWDDSGQVTSAGKLHPQVTSAIELRRAKVSASGWLLGTCMYSTFC
jgi:hypothetical protein